MPRIADQWPALWPALAFLLAGVPLASLLDRVGFFTAAASLMIGRGNHERSVLGIWILAALTTAVLNLDTTVVLLTPLCLRLARHCGVDPVPLAAIPLLLASFASSVLPISNLTTLIAAQRFHLTAFDVLSHLALPSLAAIRLVSTMPRALVLGPILGAAAGFFGFLASHVFDVDVGASQTAIAVLIVGLAEIVRAVFGLGRRASDVSIAPATEDAAGADQVVR